MEIGIHHFSSWREIAQLVRVRVGVREKVRVYVRVNFASGGRQGATPETDPESRRVFAA